VPGEIVDRVMQRKPVIPDNQVDQPPIPGIDIVGDNRDHATSRFDHTLVKSPAYTDSSIAHGRENSRTTLVTETLEPQHLAIENGACLKVVGIHPTDLRRDVRFAIFQMIPPSEFKKVIQVIINQYFSLVLI
jgi:hypothetical protein